jgi:glycine betaine/proline transport system ATP-binding protein
MKDGAVVQVATPEDLVLSPADDYVRAFTGHVARAKVVTLGRLVAPGVPGGIVGTLPASARVEEVAEQIVAANAPFAVERDGQVIGHITPQAVIAVLVGRGA